MKRVKSSKEKIKKKNKLKSFIKMLLFIIAIILVIYIIVLAGRYIKYLVIKDRNFDPLSAAALGIDPEKLKSVGRINILVMGESGIPGDDYKLTDSIMLVTYNPQTQQASILSIPRDTYVGRRDRFSASQNYLASYKINAAYRNGTNIEETIELVSDLTGVEIDNYVLIDTDAIVDIVDAIGGVVFNVPIDMDYDDLNQDLHIHLKAGEQLIDGDKAEQLLRFRHNQDGSSYPAEYGDNDIGRMRTQREFIQATLKQLIKIENVTKVFNLINIVFDNIKTDLNMETIKYYIPYAFKFNTESIQTGTLPGTSEQCNGIWLYIANKSETKELIDQLFTDIIPEDENSTNIVEETETDSNTTKNDETNSNKIKDSDIKKDVKIELLNGSGKDINLDEVKNKLIRMGYSITKTGITTDTSKTIIVNRTNKSEMVENDLKEALGASNVNSGANNSNVDFTIIIGKDYK